MNEETIEFDANRALEHLRHYLPSQAALKDFVHHNTLHAFDHATFHDALWSAAHIFGYSTYLSLDEFRALYSAGKIRSDILERIIWEKCRAMPAGDAKPQEYFNYWKNKLLEEKFDKAITARLFQIRRLWKDRLRITLDKVTHPILFRVLAAYLDQGISNWSFPTVGQSFLDSLCALERNGIASLFKTKRAQRLLLEQKATLKDLLDMLVGDPNHYEQYLFDQQFAHPGWSGFVSVVEKQPETLLDARKISLHELVYFELLLEIDTLDDKFGSHWQPLMAICTDVKITPLFGDVAYHELKTTLQIWQEAYEWSYFDGVLSGIQKAKLPAQTERKSFQGLFCIDDREYSLRRHIELVDKQAETFGTPGFFGVEFYFQPENGKFYTKACPAPINPAYLIKEENRKRVHKADLHFHKRTHSLLTGGIVSGTLGFWSAIKLLVSLFKPSVSAAMAYSFAHMDRHARLQIESTGEFENNLQVGFTVDEMAARVRTVLSSIGLTKQFAPIVYVVGHGGSSINNPYYAGYDCGACCGRPGAVNARVFAYMANKREVRDLLCVEGIIIPDTTYFIGAMHDTTRDEIEFYDDDIPTISLREAHAAHKETFYEALSRNAKERSFRFDNIDSKLPINKLHKEVKKRSVSIFEPRPEWNHTDNALCIIGRSALYKSLYLDKRPFINSYDCAQDPDGKYLLTILNAAIPVCGGINLEYYFSRVDQTNLGAGTKLPHNIVGLFAVNNGIDGDLRTGLPSQMIEIHDPVRILFIVEHNPDTVMEVIRSNPAIYKWIANYWVLFSVVEPSTREIFVFDNHQFTPYKPMYNPLTMVNEEAFCLPIINKEEPVVITTHA